MISCAGIRARLTLAGFILCVAGGLVSLPIYAAKTSIPDDPYFSSKGTWGQDYADQWALHRIGFSPAGKHQAIWNKVSVNQPVIVALIDSGIVFYHPDLNPETIWYNPGEIENGIDDDGNGYIDDIFGWDFVDNDNRPWDRTGHGTHIAGIIAAAGNNGRGITGVNPAARLMVLRVLNFIGRGRSVPIAAAIHYAVDQGARVINLSVGGRHLSPLESQAVDYAFSHDVVVVAAAGNEGSDTIDYGPAGLRNLITVTATDSNDQRQSYSNWGEAVDIAAPGVDVLSLRGRFTDVLRIADKEDYQPGNHFVDPVANYYRMSGTSFAAPFVSGVASLIIAGDAELTARQVMRMILHSARDIGAPGIDQFTGYGLLDANAALDADADFYVEAQISGVTVVSRDGKPLVQVNGTADANKFKRAWIELGQGEDPTSWKKVSRKIKKPVLNSELDALKVDLFRGAKQWTLKLITVHKKGQQREIRFLLNLG